MLRARQVLEDAKAARSRLEGENDEQMRRLLWVASIVLARAALHVLDKVDAAADEALREKADLRWAELKKSRPEPAIFWNFLELERNLIAKQFEISPDLKDSFLMLPGGKSGNLLLSGGESRLALAGFFAIRTDGPFKGRDGRQLLGNPPENPVG